MRDEPQQISYQHGSACKFDGLAGCPRPSIILLSTVMITLIIPLLAGCSTNDRPDLSANHSASLCQSNAQIWGGNGGKVERYMVSNTITPTCSGG